MEMIFNAGTVIIENLEQRSELQKSHDLKWDDRIARYRGPAHLWQPIIEEMTSFGFNCRPPTSKFSKLHLNEGKTQLRPYQEAALCSWDISGRRGIIALPTGGGKTRVAIGAILRTHVSTLILVPTRVLLQQWVSSLKTELGIDAGILGDGTREIQNLTVATFESAYRNMATLGDQFELLIIDEVHHFGHSVRDEALEMSMAPFRLGLTATPPEEQIWHERMAVLVGPMVYEMGLEDLRGRYLADFELLRLHVELNHDERLLYEREIQSFRMIHQAFRDAAPQGTWKDFVFYASRTEAGRKGLTGLRVAQDLLAYPQAKRQALSQILTRHLDDKVLIFTADTATAYLIAKTHLLMPLTSEISRKEREEAVRWFRENEISKMVSCQVLNEGFDVPDANIAVILGGRRGTREHLQRIGRILRWKEGQKAKIYELVCNRTIEVKQADKRGRSLAV